MSNGVDQELLESIQEEVEAMSEEELEAEAKKIIEQQAKRKQYSKNRVMSPEAKAKQKLYRKKQYEKNKLVMARFNELHPEEAEEVEPFEEEA